MRRRDWTKSSSSHGRPPPKSPCTLQNVSTLPGISTWNVISYAGAYILIGFVPGPPNGIERARKRLMLNGEDNAVIGEASNLSAQGPSAGNSHAS